VLAFGYEWLAIRAATNGRSWSRRRTASFLTGCLLLILALAPATHGDFLGHTAQHLLVGMYAPLALVLGAPVTLVLRTLPSAGARAVGRILHARAVRVLGHPITALGLNVGGLAVLYLTPLYAATVTDSGLHRAVQLHFLASGCLFAWVIAGPDPAPRRPPVPARLVVLGVAIAAHAVLAQLLYAGAVVDLPATTTQRQAGAALMYYGGDLAELLLALALLSAWRGRRTHQPRAPSTTPAAPVIAPPAYTESV
jgi:putative membrane protein